MQTAGELIVASLVANGIDRVFCVPGESYLGLLDALHGRTDIDTVVCRHESGAGFMALADARLTGRPGVALVSRGPGASNAAIAVHTAQQDGVPFLLVVGQVAARDVRRDSFQEVDYGHMFGRIAKWVAEVTDADRMAETMLRAIQVATTGLPGPVVIVVPEDVLCATTAHAPVQPQAPVRAGPLADDIETLREMMARSRRPLLIAGSGFEKPGGRAALAAFAASWQMPVVVSFRRQDLFDNADALYAGDLGLANPAAQLDVFRDADLLLVLGARLSDITTQGYMFPDMVRPQMRLVHVHEDPAVIGVHFAADLAIACDPRHVVAAIGTPADLPDRQGWIDRLAIHRRRIAAMRSFDVDDGIPFEAVVDIVGRNMAPDGILTLDAGMFAAPAYRIIPFRPPQRLLAPIAGAMGFGVPAAVAAALRAAGRQVICLIGDGGFLMTGNELATVLERGLALKVVLAENGIYGSIRLHQERAYPGRVSGTSFSNPDLTTIGRAFGFTTTRLETMADLEQLPALLARPGQDMIVVRTSNKAILP
jgi:acetolactate synthase-1/2/3 large subunit